MHCRSDDILTSNFHRVKMPGVEQANNPRYSIAFFAQPNRSSLVQGLKHKYPPITAGDYVAQVIILSKCLSNNTNTNTNTSTNTNTNNYNK
jgi:isopenicillin N synthase-like dioxygenase